MKLIDAAAILFILGGLGVVWPAKADVTYEIPEDKSAAPQCMTVEVFHVFLEIISEETKSFTPIDDSFAVVTLKDGTQHLYQQFPDERFVCLVRTLRGTPV